MVAKKKPEGKYLVSWCREWDNANHTEKINICRDMDITYETARHWRSDCGIPREEDLHPRLDVDDILALRPAVNLDFVCFDVETSNLNADFSVLLTACIKPFGQDSIVFRADEYDAWDNDRDNDYDITRDIAEELRKHAVVIGHYSQRFDIPFLRFKMTKHGLEPLPQMFGIDTWRIAKNNFKMSSRRLDSLASAFDLGAKYPVEGKVWMKAAYSGSREAMDKIVAHNIVDVEILEKLACISFPFLRSIPRL